MANSPICHNWQSILRRFFLFLIKFNFVNILFLSFYFIDVQTSVRAERELDYVQARCNFARMQIVGQFNNVRDATSFRAGF